MGDEDPIPPKNALDETEDPVMGLFDILKSARGKNFHKVPEASAHSHAHKPPAFFWKIVLFLAALATTVGWMLQSRARFKVPVEPLNTAAPPPSSTLSPQAPAPMTAPPPPPPPARTAPPVSPSNHSTYDPDHSDLGRGPADFGGREIDSPDPIQDPPPLPAEPINEIVPEIPDTQFD